jgi:hypothetical protein
MFPKLNPEIIRAVYDSGDVKRVGKSPKKGFGHNMRRPKRDARDRHTLREKKLRAERCHGADD